jgi:hypothetical protein
MQDNSDDLRAARDFREQQQAKFKERLDEFSVARRASSKAAIKHLDSFLPKSIDIAATIDESVSPSASAGPSDEPITHKLVERLCHDIEAAALKLGMPMHGGISAGSILRDGIEAMQQRVMMTNASVVMLTPSLLLLCNRVAKLIARSQVVTPTDSGWVSVSHDIDGFRTMIKEDAALMEDWMRLFYDCAYDLDNPNPGRVYGIGGQRLYIWGQIRDAMELFAVGHEYGHHIANHSLKGEASSVGEEPASRHEKETEADLLGTVLACHAGADGAVPNAYAISGAGAALLLVVLEFSRRAQHILLNGVEPEVTRDTHPPLEVRLQTVQAAAKSVASDDEEAYQTLQAGLILILDEVWQHTKVAIRMMHDRGMRPVINDHGWLPS